MRSTTPRLVAAVPVLMGHSLDFMMHMEPSSLRPGGQRLYNGATQVGGGRWAFHHPLFLVRTGVDTIIFNLIEDAAGHEI